MEVAREILKQLGGNKFRMMTGAKNFVAGENYLTMKIGRNKTACNRLKITLNSMDTYDMRFSRVSIGRWNSKSCGEFKETSVKEYDGVDDDMLQEIFTLHTGMYTRLF